MDPSPPDSSAPHHVAWVFPPEIIGTRSPPAEGKITKIRVRFGREVVLCCDGVGLCPSYVESCCRLHCNDSAISFGQDSSSGRAERSGRSGLGWGKGKNRGATGIQHEKQASTLLAARRRNAGFVCSSWCSGARLGIRTLIITGTKRDSVFFVGTRLLGLPCWCCPVTTEGSGFSPRGRDIFF